MFLEPNVSMSATMQFNCMVADIEEYLRKGRWGGVKLGENIFTVADDIVLLAEEEEEMKCLIKRVEKYLNEKRLELNREKIKIVRFRKGGKKERDKMDVEGKEDRGSEKNKIFEIYITDKW